MMDWFFNRKTTVRAGPTDRVLPLHFFENSPLVQGNNMAVSLVFNEALSPEKLKESLESLVKREGWQKVGGRLRKNDVSGKIEWHIPTHFTSERPAINYSHVDHGIPTSEHAAASKIPEPTSRPCVVGDPDLMADLAWGEGYRPGGISDYLGTDKPVLGLRVNSFTDKTIVVLQWQHVAFDALGMQYVVENWARVLQGKESETPTPCGTEADPFNVLATGVREPTEEHVLSDRRVGIAGMLKWGLGYGVDMLVRAKENRMVCVPESFWKLLYEKAIAELKAEASAKSEDPSKVFLTENDILTAWIIRYVVEPLDMDPKRTVAGSIAMSLRKPFEGDLLPAAFDNKPYVDNAFGWGNVLVTACEVSSKPLSWLARQVRRAINEQGTRAQHEAYFSIVRTSGTGLPVVIMGDGGMAQIGFSNWSKAGLFDLDFSPARMAAKDGPCRPSYVQENHGLIKPADGFFILGKDSKGNYWTSACKMKGQWAIFQKQFEKEFEVGRQ